MKKYIYILFMNLLRLRKNDTQGITVKSNKIVQI